MSNQKPNYFRIKEFIMVSALTVATIADKDFQPAMATRWAEVIRESICTLQNISVEAIAEVLTMAYTCISEETQTYQYMQIGDSQMEDIMIKHGCN